MKQKKLSSAEWTVMDVIWQGSDVSARDVVDKMKELESWNKNTTYTVLNRLIQKGFIKRDEPNFICTPLISKEDTTYTETVSFLEKIYNGSLKMMVSNFLSKENLSQKELEEIKSIIDSKKDN